MYMVASLSTEHRSVLSIQWLSVIASIGLATYALIAQQPFVGSDYVGWFLMLGVPAGLEVLTLLGLFRERYRQVRWLTAALLPIWAVVAVMIAMNPVYLAFADSFPVRLAAWIAIWLLYSFGKVRILRTTRASPQSAGT